jgi:copper chaperone NosL
MRCPRLTTRFTWNPTRVRLVALVLALAFAGCAPAGPRAIRYGDESCGYCRMTITDRRFGGQATNAHGRIEAFDSIECLADYVNAVPTSGPRPTVWVVDFQRPGTFISADSARFVRLAAASSPMGAGLAATVATAPANAIPTTGSAMSWAELLLSRREAPDHAR